MRKHVKTDLFFIVLGELTGNRWHERDILITQTRRFEENKSYEEKKLRVISSYGLSPTMTLPLNLYMISMK